MLKPSGFTTGSTIVRAVPTSVRTERSVAYFLSRSWANSIGCSAAGHSRAWWTPMVKKTGLPSATLAAFVVISRASTSRPSSVFSGSTSWRTSLGYLAASCFISSW